MTPIGSTWLHEGLRTERSPLALLRLVTWTLSNLCDSRPPGTFRDTHSLLPVLLHVLRRVSDPETLSHVCWALSHICSGPVADFELLVDNPAVCSRLVNLLGNPSIRVVKPALRAVGNIVCAESELGLDPSQAMVNARIVPRLCDLLCHDNR